MFLRGWCFVLCGSLVLVRVWGKTAFDWICSNIVSSLCGRLKFMSTKSHNLLILLLDTVALTHLDLWPLWLAGSSVAQLKANDPEGEPLVYGVSGEEAMRYFSVNQDTGVVWLRQQLDREVRTPKQHTDNLLHTLAYYQNKCTQKRQKFVFLKNKKTHLEYNSSNTERAVGNTIPFGRDEGRRAMSSEWRAYCMLLSCFSALLLCSTRSC